MKGVRVIVLRTAGTNCDQETKFAFDRVGANAELVHVNELIADNRNLSNYQILAIPGGFTYGDDIASGKVLANELIYKLGEELKDFVSSGKLIIGICNGFQVLVKSGLLPGESGKIETSLSINDSGRFEDRWVYLEPSRSICVWTKGVTRTTYLPVAHAEGKFIPRDNSVLDRLKKNNQVVFRYSSSEYPSNPNGSVDNVAGICDATGRIFGLMPHPERHFLPYHHPHWRREGLKKEGDGTAIFRNGINFVQKNL